jgi:hypothetical protein
MHYLIYGDWAAATMMDWLPQINIRQSPHSEEMKFRIAFNLGNESEGRSERRMEEDERGRALPAIPLPIEITRSHW